LTNARYDDMRRALIDFDQKARGAELALIFFSGHGFQIGGENWLIPVDAQLAIVSTSSMKRSAFAREVDRLGNRVGRFSD
jgi:uncharacterized caspase-like protein